MFATKFFRLARAMFIAALLGVPVFTSGAMAQASATLGQAEATSLELKGFRSAEFGMDEDAVLEAIKSDFGLEGDTVNIGLNTVERTRVITIMVPNILPDGGTAQVSYIFGYQSKALIQVGLLWAASTDAEITDEMLYANADLLRAYFTTAGYQPETISRDVVLENGILLFRGADASGHTAILLLQGQFQDDGSELSLRPEALTLLYASNPDNPDILSLSPGEF